MPESIHDGSTIIFSPIKGVPVNRRFPGEYMDARAAAARYSEQLMAAKASGVRFFQLSVVSFQLSYRLSVVSYQLSVVSKFRSRYVA